MSRVVFAEEAASIIPRSWHPLSSHRLAFFWRVRQLCGDIGQYCVLSRTLILLSAPAYARGVLVEHADSVDQTRLFRTLLHPLLGDGLLTGPRALHHQQRRLIAPTFQPRRIAAYADTIVHYTGEIERSWQDGAAIDLAQEMMRLTLSVIGRVLFDADLLAEARELGAAITTAIQWTMAEFTTPMRLPYTWPTPRNRRLQRSLARLDALIERMIAERRESSVERADLLSLLLQSQDGEGDGMASRLVRDELMTLFVAGHETTANALAWTWYLLAQHPAVYTRVRAEVDQVLAGRAPTYADLVSLPYTLRVLKEALRLYSPVPSIPRQVRAPFVLDGYMFPAGAVVVVSPYLMHRLPEYFADPERFNPDRWTPEQERQLPQYVYLPFGLGERSCIGNHFALMEAQLVLATLAQHMTFELVPGQQIVPQPMITLRPRDGIQDDCATKGAFMIILTKFPFTVLLLIAATVHIILAEQDHRQVLQELAVAHVAAHSAAQTNEAFITRLVHDLAPPVQGLTSVILGSRWHADQQTERDIAHHQLRLLEHFVHQARTYLQVRTVDVPCTLVSLLPLCRTAISTVAQQAQQRGIRLIQEVEVEEPSVWGNEAALLRVLDNLLTNALGVTSDEGMVIVRVTTPVPSQAVSASWGGGMERARLGT